MPCLNDIEVDIIERKYIFELINLIEKDLHVDLYGMYLRFLNVSLKCLKLENNKNILYNIKSLLLMLIRVNIYIYIYLLFTKLNLDKLAS